MTYPAAQAPPSHPHQGICLSGASCGLGGLAREAQDQQDDGDREGRHREAEGRDGDRGAQAVPELGVDRALDRQDPPAMMPSAIHPARPGPDIAGAPGGAVAFWPLMITTMPRSTARAPKAMPGLRPFFSRPKKPPRSRTREENICPVTNSPTEASAPQAGEEQDAAGDVEGTGQAAE
ncbi:hypothetical protein GCM10020254_48360 [Streptomyces goshikiensis]